MENEELAGRMHECATDYISDANILSSNLDTQSDAPEFLEILAMEILLKCVILLAKGEQAWGHEYKKLWDKIPDQPRQDIFERSRRRLGPDANMDRLDEALANWEEIFVDGRYSYERYKDLNDVEIVKLGNDWIKKGAPIEEADLKYFPYERTSLIAGLRDYIEGALGIERSLPLDP